MKRDIAIIGLSGKFPKSENINSFWNNLKEGKELVSFFSKEELQDKNIEGVDAENFVKASSFIADSENFDYPFFKYTLDEALIMNPQTRMMHQLVWKALEDSACNIEKYNKKIGIFLGADKDVNWSLYSSFVKNENVDELTRIKIANPNFMSSLISYKLNFTGPCYFIDTACSTSLSAVHLACRSLLLNECGIAVTGGIRMLSFKEYGYHYQQGSIASSDGHNYSFDENASGTISAEGAGVVILKKLEEALKDKDPIYCVIKSTAMNNDGSNKGGYTIPSVKGQSDCIKLAHKIAGVSPDEISYIEANGTGTKIGDPIEIESLNVAFGNNVNHKCAIGSVKSNMGHASEAAGVISLIKTALAIKNKIIPASINYNSANPAINFNEGPFYVNAATTKWESDKPLVAGVNSLGIGGTNVHTILKEAPAVQKTVSNGKPKLFPYSAISESALDKVETNLLKFLENQKEISLSDLAYTLQVGRKSLSNRKYLMANDREDLIQKIKQTELNKFNTKKKENVIFMFSGLRNELLDFDFELYNEFDQFKQYLEEGFSYLKEMLNVDFKEAVFGNGAISEINNTQLVHFLLEYSFAKFLISLGVKPNYLLGDGIGEFIAACISGVIDLKDALRIVSVRVKLLNSKKSPDLNFKEFEDTLNSVEFSNPTIPFISNVSGELITDEQATSINYWSDQIAKDAEFEKANEKAIKTLSELSNCLFIEIGQGKKLTGYCTLNHNQNLNIEAVNAIRDPLEKIDNEAFLFNFLGEIWLNGFDIDWSKIYKENTPNKISIPSYTFDKIKVLGKVSAEDHLKSQGQLSINENQTSLSFYLPSWQYAPKIGGFVDGESKLGNCLFFSNDDDFSKNLLDKLVAKGNNVIEVQKGLEYESTKKQVIINPKNLEHFKKLIDDLRLINFNTDTFVFGWKSNSRKKEDVDCRNYSQLNESIFEVSNIINHFNLYEAEKTKKFVLISDESQVVIGSEKIDVKRNHIATLLKTVSQETENIVIVDIDLEEAKTENFEEYYTEILSAEKYTKVAYRNGMRWLPLYSNIDLNNSFGNSLIKQNGTYLIIGNLDEVDFNLTKFLSKENNASVHILTNSDTLSQAEFDKKQSVFNKLKSVSKNIYFKKCNVQEYSDLLANIEEIEKIHGPINGVVQTIQNNKIDSLLMANQLSEETAEPYSVSIKSLLNIDRIFSKRNPDFIKIISTISSFLGGISYAAYSTTSSLMENIALSNSESKNNYSIINLDRVADEDNWIYQKDLEIVFQKAFTVQNLPQIIVSKRNINSIEYSIPKENVNARVIADLNRSDLSSIYRTPKEEIEFILLDIFENLFGVNGIGVDDDFFELGGDSLKGMTLINRIKKQLDVEMSIQEMFNNKSIAEIALLVTEKKWLSESNSELVNELVI